MANLIALEWDDAEARVAVADSRRGSIVLEQAFSIALPKDKTAPDASGATGAISVSGAHDLGAIGRRISEALTARGVRRVKTVVGVGRANIELKNLTLPPSPLEELPELVRFQADREFNTLTDEWHFDFLPIPGEADEAITVLAAAISPELVAEIQITCEAANLTPQKLILRPCAAASLLSRAKPVQEEKLRLLVDLLTEEADLTVLAGDSPVFMRTARLPAEAANVDPLRTLLPEIRRTIAAVHARYQGRQVEQVFICGEATAQAALAREIGRELSLPTEVFNPLTCCTVAPNLKSNMPDHPGRFAPLVGMLMDDAAGSVNTIDFLNPRKKPEAKNRRREMIIGGAIAALVLLTLGGWIGYESYSMGDEIAQKTDALQKLDDTAKKLQDVKTKAEAIDRWYAGGLNWLDEFAALANKAPKGQDIMLTSIQIPYQDTRNGKPRLELHLEGVAKDNKVIENMQTLIDDERHDIFDPSVKEPDEKNDKLKGKYPLRFDVHVDVKPPDPNATAMATSTKSGTAAASKSASSPGATSSEKTAADKSPTEKSASKKTPADKPAEKSGAEKSDAEKKSGAEKSTIDKSVEKSAEKSAEKPTADKPVAEKATAEKSSSETPATDKSATEKSESDSSSPNPENN